MSGNNLEELLKQYWGFDTFRPLQKDIVEQVLTGSDVFTVLPTGGGKSLCYQLPALAIDGFCIVVSPLIALMQDQVLQLQSKNISAAFLHSGMNQKQIEEVIRNAAFGKYKLLYVSPERLQSERFRESFVDFHVNLIAVDEAHCISQWGHDFRPSYRHIHEIRAYFPKVPILALTATATEKVKTDIMLQLDLKNPMIFLQTVVRKNLFYTIRYTENKPQDLNTLFHAVKGSGILYCRTRKKCVDSAVMLKKEGINSTYYHAGLEREQRRISQENWMESASQIMCATTAFGMGIDKPNVRIVAHYDAPYSLEEYYQEAGRAGRDNNKSFSVLLYNHLDILRLQHSVELSYPPLDFIRKVYHQVSDYLQIAVDGGEETMFPFDVLKFIHNFKLETLKTLNAIKILEREGYWIFDEDTHTQSIVQFTANKERLGYLSENEPRLHQITLGLMRLHGSIFHFPTSIKIFETAKLLRMDFPSLHKGLLELRNLGFLEYQPALRGSSLFLIQARVARKQLFLNESHIAAMRLAHEHRISAVVQFLENKEVCRNIQLAQYFGERIQEICGECDVCKLQKVKQSSRLLLKTEIQKILMKEQEISIQDLTSHFQSFEKTIIIEIIRDMADENLCSITSIGFITIR